MTRPTLAKFDSAKLEYRQGAEASVMRSYSA
jgi:hypothetical protein